MRLKLQSSNKKLSKTIVPRVWSGLGAVGVIWAIVGCIEDSHHNARRFESDILLRVFFRTVTRAGKSN